MTIEQGEKTSSELVELEKQDWNLRLSAILLIFLLTFSLLIFFLPDLLNVERINVLKPEELDRYLGFLGLLVLMYAVYSMRKHGEIKRLRYELMAKGMEVNKLSQVLNELRNIFELVATINIHGDLGKVFDLIVKDICAALKADSSSVMLIEENIDTLLPKACRGINDELFSQSRVKLGEGIAGWVVEEGKPLLLNRDEDIKKFRNVPKKLQSISSAMCIPIIIDGKVTGVVNLNRYRGKEKFTERDLKLAQIFVHDAAVAIRSARLMEDSKQRMVLEEKNRLLFKFLSRYVPEKMASQILEDPERYLTLGGERVDLTILFADIRGFTHFAATNEPEKVVETLNHIFTELTKVVFANSGYINKFIGDCLMSIYDKQYTDGNEVFMALKTAVEMQGVFKKIIEEQIHSNGLSLGIGVNSGEVVIGNIGSEDLMDYTVIGDNVNIALLLEEQAKGGQILISRDTYQRIQDKLEAKRLPPQPLRGRAGEIEVYEVLGVKK